LSQVHQLSRSRRPKWHYLAVGVGLIVVAVALTVAWGILAAPETAGPRAVAPARVLAYFFGSVMFLLLIAGLVLIVLLLLREVRLNERQSNFVSAVTHELKTPVASLKLYLETLEYRDVPPERRAEFYRTMRQDIERLNATINKLDAEEAERHVQQGEEAEAGLVGHGVPPGSPRAGREAGIFLSFGAPRKRHRVAGWPRSGPPWAIIAL
jgi:signal transduction histidine kinase